MRLIHVTTVPATLGFLRRQVGFMKSQGFEVHAVSSPGSELDAFAEEERVRVHPVVMNRSISPCADVVGIMQLIRLFRKLRPDIVHAHTPKAGLLTMVAARLTRVPCRIFHLHGLPHSTASGVSKQALIASTRAASFCATQVFSVSSSVALACTAERLCAGNEIAVLAAGSINGVDGAGAFDPKRSAPRQSRARFGLPVDALVIGFAGRLVGDKGLVELYRSWEQIRAETPNAYLAIAGHPEERDALPNQLLSNLRSDPRVRMLGQVKDMPPFYAALDVFVLPTYREGLPTVILESSAMGVPAVTTRALGAVDSVVDGVTGQLVDVGDSEQLTEALLRYLKDSELRVQHGFQAREHMLRNFRPEEIWNATLSAYREALTGSRVRRDSLSGRVVKRTIDICVALAVLALLAPLLAVLALLARLQMGSPVFFRQARPGLRGASFQMIKFRTMRDARDAAGELLSDAERLTAFGRFLRRTSMDELPELWNVLKGEMSLVGPRPLLPQYLPRYTEFQRRRHDVKPGISGWAQVNGRNALNWEEKFRLDVWYVDHASFLLDLKILWLTLLTVLRRDGIAQQGHATMPEFLGSTNSLRNAN